MWRRRGLLERKKIRKLKRTVFKQKRKLKRPVFV